VNERNVGDLLFLQACGFEGADWFAPALFLRPTELKRRAGREKWSDERIQSYLTRVERLREMAQHHSSSDLPSERELSRLASLIVRKWDDAK
jgi:hypothetical protein